MKKASNLIAGAFLAAVALTPGLVLAQGQPAGERYGYPQPHWDQSVTMPPVVPTIYSMKFELRTEAS